MEFYDTYILNPLVKENRFKSRKYEPESLPTLEKSKSLLPQPHWQGHESTISCYNKIWELAFANLRQPTAGNGFVANYIDTAFNDHLFMWDSCFILLFCIYGRRAFIFLHTLDNLYAKQHPDGFICREINEADGQDCFCRFDPSGTGPNVMPWTEWEYFRHTGDRERLADVFPVLLAYHQWFMANRTWQDGSYWATGWACGMDNQPRVPYGDDVCYSNGRMTWADTCMQQILSARILLQMSRILGREKDTLELVKELKNLYEFTNKYLWDDKTAFFYDRLAGGELNGVKTIGAFWSLLAGIIPSERLQRFVAHLDDPREFARPHRIPTLSADNPRYEVEGGYWLGAVWAPTNYMVLRGLVEMGQNELAYRIARNHLENVVKVYEQTGTVWENYAPEAALPGNPSKGDFVGWTGLPPVAVLLENVFGLKADVPKNLLIWDIRLLEEHGVKNYPFGKDDVLDLFCPTRTDEVVEPNIEVKASIPLDVEIRWAGGSKTISIKP